MDMMYMKFFSFHYLAELLRHAGGGGASPTASSEF